MYTSNRQHLLSMLHECKVYSVSQHYSHLMSFGHNNLWWRLLDEISNIRGAVSNCHVLLHNMFLFPAGLEPSVQYRYNNTDVCTATAETKGSNTCTGSTTFVTTTQLSYLVILQFQPGSTSLYSMLAPRQSSVDLHHDVTCCNWCNP